MSGEADNKLINSEKYSGEHEFGIQMPADKGSLNRNNNKKIQRLF